MSIDPEAKHSPPIPPMLVVGREAIAALLNTKPRHIDELWKRRELPIFKLGNKLAVRREALIEHFAKQEQANLK